MGIVGELTVKIGADLADLKQKIGEAQSRVDGMSSKMQSVGAGMMKVGGAMSLAVTAPILLMGKMGMDELNEIQTANAQTAAAIKNVGAGSLISAGHIQKQAAALQQLSGMDDQAIQGAENLLLRFGNLNVKTKEGAAAFDRAGKLAVDMGVSMGGPEAAAKALAKGLADPENMMTRLGKSAGLTKPQMAGLKKEMEAAHSPAQKQAILMAALESKYNGAAAAAGGTMAAKVAVMKDQLAAAAAGVMTQMLPAMTKLVEWVSKATEKFSSMSPHAQKITAILVTVAAAAGPVLIVMGSIASAIGALIPIFAAVPPIATAMWVAITGPVGLVILAVMAVVAVGLVLWKHWDDVKAALHAAWDAIKNKAVSVFTGIKDFIAQHAVLIATVVMGPIGGLVVWLVKNWDDVKAKTSAAWAAIKGFIGDHAVAIATAVTGPLGGLIVWMVKNWDTIEGGARAGWNAIKKAIVGVVEGFPAAIAGGFDGLVGKLAAVGSAAGTALADGIKKAVNYIIGKWNDFEIPAISVAGKDVTPAIGTPNLATFARGGIATAPSIFGEAGPEAAVPLGSSAQNRADRRRVLGEIGAGGGGGDQHFHFHGADVNMFAASQRAAFHFGRSPGLAGA